MILEFRTEHGDYYRVTEEGYIRRMDMPNMAPSSQWRFEGLKHCRKRLVLTRSQVRRMFGPEPSIMGEITPPLLYKNGKPQWRVIDFDHGSYRVWGEGVTAIYAVS